MSVCTLKKTSESTGTGKYDYGPMSNGRSTVNKVIVICNRTGIKSSSYEGEHGRGLKRALALLGEKCKCGQKWHYVSNKDLKYYDPGKDWKFTSSESESESEAEYISASDSDSDYDYVS
jgi:hypothetical protein